MSVTWNCPHDSWNHDVTFRFKETGVKVTFKTLLCPYDHRKIVQVDFTDEIESYIWLMIELKCLLTKV